MRHAACGKRQAVTVLDKSLIKKYINAMKFGYLLIFSVLLTACNQDKREYVIGLNERIHHDYFEYSVSNLLVSRFLKNGPDTLKAQGVFYMVTFRTDNLAMRVSHKWDNSIAYIVDERGRIFENKTDVQQFYEKSHSFGLKEEYITPAGRSDSIILAFDLPFDVTKPYLKVRGEILMGDMFDRARFRRMRIRLY
jgi:hypothetical protein